MAANCKFSGKQQILFDVPSTVLHWRQNVAVSQIDVGEVHLAQLSFDEAGRCTKSE